jgi:integrase
VLPFVQTHLDEYVGEGDESFVFTTENGHTIWRSNFSTLTAWKSSVAKIGAAGLHSHDLRHTGNTLAARTGTSLRDLMARMGHDSPRAALMYQHATADADQAIAAAVSALVKAAVAGTQGHAEEGGDTSGEDDDGAAGALVCAS